MDYSGDRRQLLRIEKLPVHDGVETDFVNVSLAYWAKQTTGPLPQVTHRQQLPFQQHSRRTLRCNMVCLLLQESFRSLSCRIADSPRWQWFCQMDQLDRVKMPFKSTLQRSAD